MDEIDHSIIKLLTKNGRFKITDLSRKISLDENINITNVGIQKRLTKLLDSGVITIQANINLKILNNLVAFLLLDVDNLESIEELESIYEQCPKVLYTFRTSGKFNLIFILTSQNIESLEIFMNCSSLKNFSSIKNLRLYISSQNMNPPFFPVKNIPLKTNKLFKCGLNCNECEPFNLKSNG